ncbi:bifunctional 2',3'-cyclic-nucleotide 2'-phosphodiesterase/3'-nucleotidase [Bacillus sp. M6-12]|uniref:bifunctional 2',3'-cyclic-nucleotide 2'-phosphodiesterase/3'-nucleotidase n=1 Tax=Bacillus sp. M6-12 TaxID=2054166 RepID=UPI0021559CC8|nr:bifunctional 2',3'-cyclic-nucleotide 2'-phosphodiesterase/3'-nucleotidase [Bacillus sp. M6-12]
MIVPQVAPAITYAEVMDKDVVKLRIMETTDTHTNLLSYDYYKGAAADKVGMVKTAQLIKQAREEAKNSVLVDNGDTIQGTPLGTYMAKINPLKDGQVHPVIRIMNEMGYDMATLGNHEFNYGLDFLDETYDDANFGYVNANVYVDDKDTNPDNDKNKFTPYKIVEKKVKDENGVEQTIKIGYLGLVAPQITDWDKANLEGKVITKDIVATAEKFVPKMKAEGADIVIAMTHSGFNGAAEANKNAEDAIYPLSKVAGIDAITFSHTHKVFPAADEKSLDALFKDKDGKVLPGVDNAKGTINGVAAVQAGFGGEKLGLIDLTLKKVDGKWKVLDSQSSTTQIYDAAAKKPTVEADQKLVDAIKAEHEATIAYTMGKLGTTTAPIHSYFALVQDDPSVQVVTAAQKWYVEKYVNSFAPEYKDTPILSVGAPFKAGRNGVEEFTEIKQGDLTIRSAGDLYLYDNTLKAILVKGSVVKEWLEMSAGKFNQIDPGKKEEQALLDPSFQVYNFDVIDGVTYQVDVTKPAKYKPDGTINNASSSRIVNLQYNGKAVDPNQDFIVVTNNYRAGGGGNFPGVKGSKYIVDSADENRQILMDYISENKEINPTIDKNWSIAPIKGDVNVTFTSSPKAEEYAKLTDNIAYTGKTDDKGFGIFTLDLSKGQSPSPGQETTKFKDVTDKHWAKNYIASLVSKGVIKGKTVTTFDPEGTITRGQFIALLVRSLGLSDGTLTLAKEVELAYKNGLTTLAPAEFNANNPITREQMAYMTVRAYEKKTGKPYKAVKSVAYKDSKKIHKGLAAAVSAANELKLMNGYTNGKFEPKTSATRAQAARVVYDFLNK